MESDFKRKRESFESDLPDGPEKIKKPCKWSPESYTIVRNLRTGGYGQIFLAQKDDKVFVVKRFFRHRKSVTLEDKFPCEYTIPKQLDHPNIVKIRDIYKDPKYYHLIMDYYEDGDMNDYCNDNPDMSINTFVHIAKQLLSTVKYCHDQGIAHLDIKLENIFLKNDNELPEIVLGDFGFATRFTDQPISFFVGTPYYSSPEIVESIPYHPNKHDVWTIGVCLYIMYTNKYPFDGSEIDDVYDSILNRQVFPLFDIDLTSKESDIYFKSVIKWMLSKDPAERPTINEVIPYFNVKIDTE